MIIMMILMMIMMVVTGATIPAKFYCDKSGQPYRRLIERADALF
jgi:hypothetical protein